MATTSPPTQRVCIGVPVYNGERTIRPTIRNLLEQTHREFEIVVYDDGSQDATPDIVADLAREDSRIVLHRADVNRGRGFARNRLLALSAGAILAWQDADDSWHPRKLELQLGFLLPLLARGTRAILLSSYEVVTQGESGPPQTKRPPAIVDADHIFSNAYRDYHFQLQATLGEADLFSGAGGFDEAMNWSEDIDVALKLVRAGVSLVGHDTDEPLATYNHSLRKAKASLVEESQAIIVARFGEFARSRGYDLERILALRAVGYLGQIYLQTDRPQKALDIALRALVSIDPSDPGDMDRIDTIARVMQAVFKGRDGGGARPAASSASRSQPASGQGFSGGSGAPSASGKMQGGSAARTPMGRDLGKTSGSGGGGGPDLKPGASMRSQPAGGVQRAAMWSNPGAKPGATPATPRGGASPGVGNGGGGLAKTTPRGAGGTIPRKPAK